MRTLGIVVAAMVVAIAVAGCGKEIKEQNLRLTEQVAQFTELNNSLTAKNQALEAQVTEMSAKIQTIQNENILLKEQMAAKIKARPVPKKRG